MNNSVTNDNSDSQALLNQIVIEFMREQKSKKRWRWFMRIFILLVILILAWYLIFGEDDKNSPSKPHVGLVDVNGSIFDSQTASAENFVKGLEDAYETTGLKALIVRINSPGGSPVQADYMYNALQYYRKKYPKIKVYAVCVDSCASAAYYVATAAEEIYANPSSIVGSIGVLYNGFGFVDTLQKLGITRRLETAGINKGFLDPFSPINPEQSKLLKLMLDEIHQVFIERVKKGRGPRLKIDELTFSGLFWTGIQAKERGLIDGFASSGEIARDLIKLKSIINYTYKQSMFDQVTKNIGTAIADQLPSAMGLKSGFKA